MSLQRSKLRSEQQTLADSFGDEYKLQVFLVWYNTGKPSGEMLRTLIEPDSLTENLPAAHTLNQWIRETFIPKALFLDEQVSADIDKKLVAQRVEMADRHAHIGKILQQKGLEYLESHDITNAKDALAAIIKGVEIEHEARVLPTDILEKLDTMSDDQLVKELTKVIQSSKILDITPNDPANDDDTPQSGSRESET